MAIDTENKRRSAGSHIAATTMPRPTGTFSEEDRAHAGYLYRDFDFDEPGPMTGRKAGEKLIIQVI